MVQLKKKLHQAIDEADGELLELLDRIVEKFKKKEGDLTPGQIEELKNRLDRFESGEMDFFTWDEMMEQLKK